jgi:hypothetical protein
MDAGCGRPRRPDAGIDAGAPACGTLGKLTVTVGAETATVCEQYGVSAIRDGTPFTRMGAVSPFLWNEEQGKAWLVMSDAIAPDGVTDETYSLCVAPGDYTLQLGTTVNAGGVGVGMPPSTGLGAAWEIGDPSRRLSVDAGAEVTARVFVTRTNVPSFDNAGGAYALWTYGACVGDGDCPAGTHCNQQTCVDLAYDIRNCGDGGQVCTGQSCCGGVCTDLSSDNANCGGCSVSCEAATLCVQGQCVAAPDAGACGELAVELSRSLIYDPTNYEGLFAVLDGGPHQNFNQINANWSAEQLKAWFPINPRQVPDPAFPTFHIRCVPPGDYAVQLWNDGCVMNLTGCGTFDNGTPPGPITYLWQVGDSSRALQVSSGQVTGLHVDLTTTDVPIADNFYGSYSLYTYGGCGTFCPLGAGCQTVSCLNGTTCAQGVCRDLLYDIGNCGGAGMPCTAQNCCNGTCTDIHADKNNCGGCGLQCLPTQSCNANGGCQ